MFATNQNDAADRCDSALDSENVCQQYSWQRNRWENLWRRVRNGTHTLLTTQRRMGKTSLVRELLRRMADEGRLETVFVDLEDSGSAADAVVEIGVQSRRVEGAWRRIKSGFANVLRDAGDRVDTLAVGEVRVKLRAGTDAGNWRQLSGHSRQCCWQ